jgi:serine/threonine-protein kinase HipA
MRLAKEGIVRSTRWALMRDGGRDHLPDWERICTELMPDLDEQTRVSAALNAFAGRLRHVPHMAKDMGVPSEILERAMVRCVEISDSVSASLS